MTFPELWASPLAPVLGVAVGAAVVLGGVVVACEILSRHQREVTPVRIPGPWVPAIVDNEWSATR